MALSEVAGKIIDGFIMHKAKDLDQERCLNSKLNKIYQ